MILFACLTGSLFKDFFILLESAGYGWNGAVLVAILWGPVAFDCSVVGVFLLDKNARKEEEGFDTDPSPACKTLLIDAGRAEMILALKIKEETYSEAELGKIVLNSPKTGRLAIRTDSAAS
jgi:hypothetical protein